MRMIEIALFILIFNVAVSFAVTNNLYSNEMFGGFNPQLSNTYTDSLNQTTQPVITYDPFGFTAATNFIGTTIAGFTQILDVMYGATIGVGDTFGKMMGGTSEAHSIATMLAFPIWVIYIIGFAQFLRGVGAKGMQ